MLRAFVALLLVALGVGSFFAVRAVSSGPGDQERVIGISRSADEIERIRSDDLAKPRFHGEINDILLWSPDGKDPSERPAGEAGASPLRWADCAPDQLETASPSRVAASELDFEATYLPPDSMLVSDWASACEGRIVSVASTYDVPGGSLVIARQAFFDGALRGIESFAPAERVKGITINDMPAVLVEPLLPDVGDQAVIVIAEPFGQTIISAQYLLESVDELIKIAEGVR